MKFINEIDIAIKNQSCCVMPDSIENITKLCDIFNIDNDTTSINVDYNGTKAISLTFIKYSEDNRNKEYTIIVNYELDGKRYYVSSYRIMRNAFRQ